jgi:DNA mismatch repair protein MutL
MREDTTTPTISSLRFNPSERPVGQRVTSWQDLLKRGESQGDIIRQKEYAPDSEPLSLQQHIEETFDTAKAAGTSSEQSLSIPEEREALPIWQLHNKYIIIPTRQGLMVIDQHAAHERVLYERAIARFADNHSKTQQLLFPHTIEFTPGDIALIQQLFPSFESLGFALKIFGKNVIILDGVPLDVKPGDESTILQNMLDLFKQDEQSIQLEPREKLAKSYSCKAAVKAGDPLNEPEMRSLMDQLFATEVPFVCPHGRPVMMTLSLAELDKRFGRTS